MFNNIFRSKRGEAGYVDIAVGVILVSLIVVIALSIFTVVSKKTSLDLIADEMLETATYHGSFGPEFEAKVAELKSKYYDFDYEISTAQWQDEGKKQVQLGNNMQIRVYTAASIVGTNIRIPINMSVSRVGPSEYYWQSETMDYSFEYEEPDRNFTFIVDTSTNIFHALDCEKLIGVPDSQKQYVKWTYEEMVDKGYNPCNTCNPHDCEPANGVEAFNNKYHWGFCECGNNAGITEHEFEYDASTNTYSCKDCNFAVEDSHKYCDNCLAGVDETTHYMDCHNYTVVIYHANSGVFPNGALTNRVTYKTATGAVVAGTYMEPTKEGDIFRKIWFNEAKYDMENTWQGPTMVPGGVYDVYAVWHSILVPGPTFNTYVKGSAVDEVIFGFRKDYENIINGSLLTDPIDVSVDKNGTILLYQVKSSDDSNKKKLYILSDDTIRANPICKNMFNQAAVVKNIAYDNFDTSLVTDMERMMQMCYKLETINTGTWNTSNVTTMFGMFQGCAQLKNFDVSKWNVGKVKTFNRFINCPYQENTYFPNTGITELDVSKWDTSSCTDMTGMFSNCLELRKLDVSNWDVSNVTSMQSAFGGGLGTNSDGTVIDFTMQFEVLDVSKWDTSKCTNIGALFRNCSEVKVLDVSNWDVSKCTIMGDAFEDCSSVTVLDVSKWDTSSCVDMEGMFDGCILLKELEVGNFKTSKVTSMASMFSDLTVSELPVGNWDTSSCKKMGFMFDHCEELQYLDVEKWNTSRVTDFNSMFRTCTSLTELDVSNWVTSSCTDMGLMFYNCSSLVNLDVSRWDTSKVTTLKQTFSSCSSLTELDVSNWNTSKVTTLDHTFFNCASLTDLDVSKWNVGNVTTLYWTFSSCSSLSEIDVSDWNTGNVTNMAATFHLCKQLQTLDVSNWNTSKVTNLQSTFNQCTNLKYVDVSNWDTSNCTNMTYTFIYCDQLNNVDVSGWNTDKVKVFQGMFYGAQNIKELDLSSFNTRKATDMTDMLSGMLRLEKLTIGTNFNFYDMDENTNCGLDAPSATYIAGADGYWYRKSDGEPFLPEDIPSNDAATYLATKPA